MKILETLRDPYSLLLVVIAILGPTFVGLSLWLLGRVP